MRLKKTFPVFDFCIYHYDLFSMVVLCSLNPPPFHTHTHNDEKYWFHVCVFPCKKRSETRFPTFKCKRLRAVSISLTNEKCRYFSENPTDCSTSTLYFVSRRCHSYHNQSHYLHAITPISYIFVCKMHVWMNKIKYVGIEVHPSSRRRV